MYIWKSEEVDIPYASMKISGKSPLKGMGGEGKGKERREARLDILFRGPRVPSYATSAAYKITFRHFPFFVISLSNVTKNLITWLSNIGQI